MKKQMTITVLLFLLLHLTACSLYPADFQENETQPVTICVWANVTWMKNFEIVQQNFNEQFKQQGIQVEIVNYDSSNSTENLKLDTSLLAGRENIDVYFTYTTQSLSQRVDSGCALDLSALCERDNFHLEELFSSNVTKFYFNGKPYSVPTTIGKMGIILNKDMLDQAGFEVPTDWTFEEFQEMARALTKGEGENKVYGVYWNTNMNISEALLHFVLPTLGGDPLYKEDGRESNLDHPVIEQALNLINATMNEDLSAPTHIESTTQKLSAERMFFDGKCAMTVIAWLYNYITDTETYPHDFVTAFAPWPVVANDSRNYTQGSMGYNVSINPRSSYIDESWEFIKWFATEGNVPLISDAFIPSYTGISQGKVAEELLKNTDGLVDAESAVALFLNPDNNLSIPVISYRINEVTACFNTAIEEVLVQKKDSRIALAEAKAQADALLRS